MVAESHLVGRALGAHESVQEVCMAVRAGKTAREQLLGEEVGQQHEGLVLEAGDSSDCRLEVLALKLCVLAPQQVQQHAIPSPVSHTPCY